MGLADGGVELVGKVAIVRTSVVSTTASCAVCVSVIVHSRIKLVSDSSVWAVVGGLLGAEATSTGIRAKDICASRS